MPNQNVIPENNSMANSVNPDVIALLQAQIAKLEKNLQDLKSESLERERQAIKERDRLFALLENLSGSGAAADRAGGGLFSKLFSK
jgi:DNA-binding MurR/RpiR family transcriptional regulator